MFTIELDPRASRASPDRKYALLVLVEDGGRGEAVASAVNMRPRELLGKRSAYCARCDKREEGLNRLKRVMTQPLTASAGASGWR